MSWGILSSLLAQDYRSVNLVITPQVSMALVHVDVASSSLLDQGKT